MENLSIHPRNWKDGNGVVKDTSKPKGERARKLDRKLKWLNARQRDREATIKQPHIKNPAAFRMPGSMNAGS